MTLAGSPSVVSEATAEEKLEHTGSSPTGREQKTVRSSGHPASNLENHVGERFGVLPNFFRVASEAPEII